MNDDKIELCSNSLREIGAVLEIYLHAVCLFKWWLIFFSMQNFRDIWYISDIYILKISFLKFSVQDLTKKLVSGK